MSNGTVPPITSQQPQESPQERLQRLLKYKADSLQTDILDDTGAVAVPGIKDRAEAEQKAMERFGAVLISDQPDASDLERTIAGSQLRGLSSKDARNQLRSFLENGGDVPEFWRDDNGPMMSPGTAGRMAGARAMERVRSEHPVQAAIYDYAVDPALRASLAAPQLVTDIGVGALNRLGANISPVDLKAAALQTSSMIRGQLGLTGGTAADYGEMKAMREGSAANQSIPAKIVGGVAESVGTIPALKGVMGLGGASRLGQAVALGASEFLAAGGREGSTPGQGGSLTDSAIAGTVGTVVGFLMPSIEKLASKAFESIIKSGLDKLAGTEGATQAGEAVAKWALKNVQPIANESRDALSQRVADGFVKAGAPGVSMPARKLAAHLAAGAVEGSAFTALDMHFWGDIIDIAKKGDSQAIGDLLLRFSTNAIASTLLRARVPLSQLVEWQRQQPTPPVHGLPNQPQEPVKPAGAIPEYDSVSQQQQAETRAAFRQGAAESMLKEKLGEHPGDVAAAEQARQQGIDEVLGDKVAAQPGEPIIAGYTPSPEVRRAAEHLMRLGWTPEPTPQEPTKITSGKDADGKPVQTSPADLQSESIVLPGTDHKITVRGEETQLSPSLQKALDLPEFVPTSGFLPAMERQTLLDQLHAKQILPGKEVALNRYATVDGVVRSIVANEVVQGPLSATEDPKPTRQPIPARGKDVISPIQEQAANALTAVLNSRMDIPEADRALLGEVINTFKTVSAENDKSVADTLATLPAVLHEMATGDTEHAQAMVKATAEMLTSKSPEVALGDMAEDVVARQSKELPAKPKQVGGGKQGGEVGKPIDPAAMEWERSFLSGMDVNAEMGTALPAIEKGMWNVKHANNEQQRWRALRELKTDLEGLRIGLKENSGPRAAVTEKIEALEPEIKRSEAAAAKEREAAVKSGPRFQVGERVRDTSKAYHREVVPTQAKLFPNAGLDEWMYWDGREWHAESDLAPVNPGLEAGSASGRIGSPGRSSERGALLVPSFSDLAGVGARISEAITSNPVSVAVAKVMARVVQPLTENPASRYFAEQLHDTIERTIGKPTAETFRQSMAKSREIESSLRPLARIAMKAAGHHQPELTPTRVGGVGPNGVEAQFSLGHILKETELQAKFGINRSSVSKEMQTALADHDEATREIRTIAAAEGIEMTNAFDAQGNRVKVAAATNKDVLTRQLTPTARDLLRVDPKFAEDLAEAIAAVPGNLVKYGRNKGKQMTQADVLKIFEDEGWTGHTPVDRHDAIETARSITYFPDAIKARDGETYTVLETNLRRHVDRMVRGASMAIGARSTFGVEAGSVKDFLDKIPPQHRELAATGVRAAFGLPVESNFGANDKSTAAALRWLNVLMGPWAAGKLSGFSTAMQNLTEVFGATTAYTGADRALRALGEVYAALPAGKFDQLIQHAEDMGFHVPIHDFGFGGEKNWAERVQTASSQASQVLGYLFTASQMMQDLTAFLSVQKAVDAMVAGEGRLSDVSLAMAVGIPHDRATEMAQGNGTPEEYMIVRKNAPPKITKRGEMPLETSAAGRSRLFGGTFKFMRWPQKQISDISEAARRVRGAKTPEEAQAAANEFWRVMFGGVMSGLASAASSKVVKHGLVAGLTYFLAEWLAHPFSETAAAYGSNTLAAVGNPMVEALSALINGEEEDYADFGKAVLHTVSPLAALVDLYDFAAAMKHRAMDEPIGKGPYSGMTALQAFGKFVGSEVPAIRTLLEGGLGLNMAAHAMGIDPKVNGALAASYRWDDKYGPPSQKFPPNSDKAFADGMRAVLGEMKGTNDTEKLVEFARSTIPAKEGETERKRDQRIAASLRLRKVLDGDRWDKLSDEQRQDKLKYLGADRVATLRGWDAMLEQMAATIYKPKDDFERRMDARMRPR